MKWKRKDKYHVISDAGYTVCVLGRIPMRLRYMAYFGNKIIRGFDTFKLAAAGCDKHYEKNNKTTDGGAI